MLASYLNMCIKDESKQLVRVSGRMVLSWNDSKVAWDRERWGISWLNFYWIQVLSLKNSHGVFLDYPAKKSVGVF